MKSEVPRSRRSGFMGLWWVYIAAGQIRSRTQQNQW